MANGNAYYVFVAPLHVRVTGGMAINILVPQYCCKLHDGYTIHEMEEQNSVLKKSMTQ